MKENVTILSIDDDPQICFALGELFKFQGWRAVSASDVASGLEAFRRYSPDIVLIDYHMPGVSGIEGVKLLRRQSSSVPIIVFTIDESQTVADTFLAAGASDSAASGCTCASRGRTGRSRRSPRGSAAARWISL